LIFVKAAEPRSRKREMPPGVLGTHPMFAGWVPVAAGGLPDLRFA
jgi:hypothetical protein